MEDDGPGEGLFGAGLDGGEGVVRGGFAELLEGEAVEEVDGGLDSALGKQRMMGWWEG